MFPNFRLGMAWIHTWFGLVLGFVLMIAFFFGSLSVFDREIDRWSIPSSRFEPQPMPSFDRMLKPIFEEVQLGTAEIRQVFRSGKFGNIAGSIIRSGTIKRGTKARLVRDGVVLAPELEIASLRREKDDVTEVREGYECGITLGYKDIQEGDIIETFEMQEKPRD